MSTYSGYVNTAYSVDASSYDSYSAYYCDFNSAKFYDEKNMDHPQFPELTPREPYGYINDPEWNDLNNEWYDTPQDHYQEPPFESPFMPPPVQQYQSQQYNASAQTTPQPSTSEPTLQELLEQMTMQNLKFKQESMKIQQETQAAMQNLSNQIGQMATLALEENADDFEDQARISNNPEPGRLLSSSTTLPIFKEMEVSIPQIDYSVDCVIKDYADDRYADNHIVAEHVFNCPSAHESESDIDIACNFGIDSCCEDVFEVQYDNLGVIPLHEISAVPHCTNHVAGGTYKLDEQTPTIEDKDLEDEAVHPQNFIAGS
ncbi:uncharacterized protein HKW66_Vig0174240 [Vigna angularis]|uniref:Uncharacterized protein n=1 Tax=Phaseolus angularis TaxID=3914 RepID=A0A8T0JLP8_PHAAN|nr:uncharacterized protein HKW66_Vig0174240 [Vigna angularis]